MAVAWPQFLHLLRIRRGFLGVGEACVRASVKPLTESLRFRPQCPGLASSCCLRAAWPPACPDPLHLCSAINSCLLVGRDFHFYIMPSGTVCIFTCWLCVYVHEDTGSLSSLPAFLQSRALFTLNYKREMFTLMQPACGSSQSPLLSASHLILSPFSPFSSLLSALMRFQCCLSFLHRFFFFLHCTLCGNRLRDSSQVLICNYILLRLPWWLTYRP